MAVLGIKGWRDGIPWQARREFVLHPSGWRPSGPACTFRTENTEATGGLQGFRHGIDTIKCSDYQGESWALGQTTTVTLLPDQRIAADMMDKVILHGPELRIETPAGAGK